MGTRMLVNLVFGNEQAHSQQQQQQQQKVAKWIATVPAGAISAVDGSLVLRVRLQQHREIIRLDDDANIAVVVVVGKPTTILDYLNVTYRWLNDVAVTQMIQGCTIQ